MFEMKCMACVVFDVCLFVVNGCDGCLFIFAVFVVVMCVMHVVLMCVLI